MSTTASTAPPGATPATRRFLAPDLARGVMLLVIAAAHGRIMAELYGGGQAVSGFDKVTELLLPMLVDARGYPMFAALFGYGLCQLYLRRVQAGDDWPHGRALLRRRGRWLVLFGLVHMALLFFGDILAIYGLVALLFAALLRFTDTRLLRHAAGWLVVGSGLYAAMLTMATTTTAADGQPIATDPLSDLGMRVLSWPVYAPFMILTTVFPFLIGVWAARRRILAEPKRHRRLLRLVAFVGVPTALLGGLPMGLYGAGVWSDPAPGALYAAEWLTVITGYGGGFGYAAVIGLIAARLSDRPGRITTALAACGQRSMTCYLLQSVAWLALFPAYTADWGSRLTAGPAVAVGAAVWLVTVLIAEFMRRRGWRGPAERALRNRTYRRRPAVAAATGS